MKTRLCWTFCLAAAVLVTTARQSPAQEDDYVPDPIDVVQQSERTRADLLAASRAAQSQLPGGSGSNANDPASNQQPQLNRGFQPRQTQSGFGSNSQRQLLPNLYTGKSAPSLYSVFDPELARINNAASQQIMGLAKKIKEAESEEAKLELKAEIKQVLNEQYEEYLNYHEAPLKELEKRLEKLRAEFESRKKAKDDLVKLRLDTIWYDAIGLGWPDSRQSAFGFPAWRQPDQPAVPFANPTNGRPPSILAPRSTLPEVDRDPYSEPPRLKTER